MGKDGKSSAIPERFTGRDRGVVPDSGSGPIMGVFFHFEAPEPGPAGDHRTISAGGRGLSGQSWRAGRIWWGHTWTAGRREETRHSHGSLALPNLRQNAGFYSSIEESWR